MKCMILMLCFRNQISTLKPLKGGLCLLEALEGQMKEKELSVVCCLAGALNPTEAFSDSLKQLSIRPRSFSHNASAVIQFFTAMHRSSLFLPQCISCHSGQRVKQVLVYGRFFQEQCKKRQKASAVWQSLYFIGGGGCSAPQLTLSSLQLEMRHPGQLHLLLLVLMYSMWETNRERHY